MPLPKALLKCCPAYCILFRIFGGEEEVEEEEEEEAPPTPEPEAPTKPPKPRGISLHLGTDNGLGQIAFTLRYDVRREILKVHICYARELVAMDPRGTSDPYVVLGFIPIRYSGIIYKTSVFKRTLRPKWYETFVFKNFPNEDLKTHLLTLTVMDWDKSGDDDVMGELEFPLKKLYKRIPGQKRRAPSTVMEESMSITSAPSFNAMTAQNGFDQESEVGLLRYPQSTMQESPRMNGAPHSASYVSDRVPSRQIDSRISNRSNTRNLARSQEELSVASRQDFPQSPTQSHNDEISQILSDPNFRSVSQASMLTESRMRLRNHLDSDSVISSSQMPPQNDITGSINIPINYEAPKGEDSTSRPRSRGSRFSRLLRRRSKSAHATSRRSMANGFGHGSDVGSVVSHGSKMSLMSQDTIFEETPGRPTEATTTAVSNMRRTEISDFHESCELSACLESSQQDCDSDITRNTNYREGSMYSSEPFGSVEEEDEEEVERPFVIRRLEVKKFLWAPSNSRFTFGEIMLGIGYYPRHGVLIFRVIKARHMRDPEGYTLNPFVGITLRRLTDKKEKTLQIFQTSVRSHVDHPVWNEQFEFKVAPRHLKHTAIDVKILSTASHANLLGQLRLAVKSYPSQREHFQSMLTNLGHIAERWHLVRQ